MSRPAAHGLRESPRLVAQRPSPERLWIRFHPRVWPLPEDGAPLLDLARGTLWGEGEIVELAPGEAVFPDLVYLPPVRQSAREARDRLATAHLSRGTPVLIQLLPGETEPRLAEELRDGALVVYDLLAALWTGELGALSRLPPGAVAVWPLVAGISDLPSRGRARSSASRSGEWESRLRFVEDGCRRLAEAGVRSVRPLTLLLDAPQSRRLAQGKGEAVFHALFHGDPGPEQEVARLLHRHGVSPFVERPLPNFEPTAAGRSGFQLRNRRLAGRLLWAADILLAMDDAAAAASVADHRDEPADVGVASDEGGRAVLPDFRGPKNPGRGRPEGSASASRATDRPSAAVGQALSLIRAAHWLDGTTYDVPALARERNLRLIPEIEPEAQAFIEDCVAAEDGEEGPANLSPRLRALIDDYLQDEEPAS